MGTVKSPTRNTVRKSVLKRVIGYVWAIAFILLGWWITALLVKSPALPTPAQTLPVLVSVLPKLASQFFISAWRVALAMVIGTVLAAPLGLMAGRSPRVDAIFAPVLYLLYPVPKVVLLPVLLVVFGLGGGPKVALIALTVFFQVLITMRDAGRSVGEEYVLAVRALGGTRVHIFWHVIVPATIPNLFTALRVSTGTAIAVLFFAESIAGTSGLGWYIMNAWGMLAYSQMFAGIIAMALLGVLFYEAFNAAEYACTAWRRAGRKG
jgi:ABC-type nitrate/sulfonate/bicarbonate transport system permease component